MSVTRLSFIRGALASLGFGALGGGRLFAAPPGWRHGGKPNLVFGVLSDTHLRTVHGPSGRPGHNWPHTYFSAALEHFKRERVDAVVHCGDFAHRGQVEEMRFHADIWRKVFGKKGPVKLFVTGNHDVDGAEYGDFVKGNYPDPEERAKHVLATDMAENWERIWGEKYEPLWHREVKGYHFIGQNFAVSDDEAIAYLKKCGGDLALDKGDRPFFFLRHRRPYGNVRGALRPLRNAVAFFGHNHWSGANWNVISLYGSLPCIQCPSCEPRGCIALTWDDYISKAKIEGREVENVGKGRQGFVVRLYDDMMVIERREFSDGASSLGADWVMPLGKNDPHPFSKCELKKVIGEPQFGKGAKLTVVKCCQSEGAANSNVANAQLETGTGNGNNSTMATLNGFAAQCLRVKIPLADGNPDSRVYAYEVVVVGEAGAPKLFKAVYAAGCNLGVGHESNHGVTLLEIPASELPPGKTLTVAARPLSSLGTFGKPIMATLKA